MGFFDMFRSFGGEALPQVPELQDTVPDTAAFTGERRADSILAAPVSEAELMRVFQGDRTVTKAQVLQIPTVQAALSLISGTMRRLELRLFEIKDGEAHELTQDERLFLFRGNTGDTLSGGQMLDALLEDYYLLGGGYCYIRRKGAGVQGLYYVENERVSVHKNEHPIFKDYDIYVDGRRYFPHEFLKILRCTHDGATGAGLVERENLLMQVLYNTMAFENSIVRRGGNKKVVLQTDRRIDPDAKATLREDWNAMYSNGDESTVILNSGLKFNEITASSVELQLNENKKSNNLEVCKLFGIPEGMLTGCGTSGASEDDKMKFAEYCILPLCAAIEGALNRDLLTLDEQRSRFFRFDTDALTRGKFNERMQGYALALKNNILLLDEVRKKENMPQLHHDSINLDLGSVLYNPHTKQGFVPNTGEQFDMGKVFAEEGKTDEG